MASGGGIGIGGMPNAVCSFLRAANLRDLGGVEQGSRDAMASRGGRGAGIARRNGEPGRAWSRDRATRWRAGAGAQQRSRDATAIQNRPREEGIAALSIGVRMPADF